MPSSKDQSTQSDGKRTAQDDVEQATIEFPGAKAESPDAADELAAARTPKREDRPKLRAVE